MNTKQVAYLKAIGITPLQLKRETRLMIIGDTPDFYQNPLFNNMLKAIELDPSDAYLTHLSPNLDEQIAQQHPALLLAMGDQVADYLLKTNAELDTLRNKIHMIGTQQTPLIVTYSLGHLLRNRQDKANAFKDLQLVAKQINELC